MLNIKAIFMAMMVFVTSSISGIFGDDTTDRTPTLPVSKPKSTAQSVAVDNIRKDREKAHLDRLKEIEQKKIEDEKKRMDEKKEAEAKVSSQHHSSLLIVNKKFHLDSGYVPSNLVVPNVHFSFSKFHPKKQLDKPAAIALELLFKEAKDNGINLTAISGYRSFKTQKRIFDSNVARKGFQAANQFSAQPGESEHQTGLAMDVSSPSVNNVLTQRFGQVKEGIWVKDHAHEFGFIIRYPKGRESITGYQYEPWHLRFVGKEIAAYIHSENITLEEYIKNE